jgi:hypothetical protein
MYIFSFKTHFLNFFELLHIKNMAININPYYTTGGLVTTSTTGLGSFNTTGMYGTSFTTTITKSKYHILGEDVEVSGNLDGTTAMMISTLNVLGKPFYDELKKNKVSFSNEIEDFLKEKFKIMERDSKIDSILEEKNSIEPPTF